MPEHLAAYRESSRTTTLAKTGVATSRTGCGCKVDALEKAGSSLFAYANGS